MPFFLARLRQRQLTVHLFASLSLFFFHVAFVFNSGRNRTRASPDSCSDSSGSTSTSSSQRAQYRRRFFWPLQLWSKAPTAAPAAPEAGSAQRRGGNLKVEISQPLPARPNNLPTTAQNGAVANLVGHYNGFTLSPLREQVGSSVESFASFESIPKSPPPAPIKTANGLGKSSATYEAPPPDYSSVVPVRPAPPIPVASAPPPPLKSTAPAVPPSSVPVVPVVPVVPPPIPKQQPVASAASAAASANIKAAKIERDALRQLEISHPIPQNVIELPSKATAIRPAPAPPPPSSPSKVGISSTLPRLPKVNKDVQFAVEEETADRTTGPGKLKAIVERSESMRMRGVAGRPAIPQFGSMRGKRPLSVPFARPTSPPPNPPNSTLSKTTEEAEESIYASIEELEREKAKSNDLLDEIVSELKKKKNIDDVSPVKDIVPSLTAKPVVSDKPAPTTVTSKAAPSTTPSYKPYASSMALRNRYFGGNTSATTSGTTNDTRAVPLNNLKSSIAGKKPLPSVPVHSTSATTSVPTSTTATAGKWAATTAAGGSKWTPTTTVSTVTAPASSKWAPTTTGTSKWAPTITAGTVTAPTNSKWTPATTATGTVAGAKVTTTNSSTTTTATTSGKPTAPTTSKTTKTPTGVTASTSISKPSQLLAIKSIPTTTSSTPSITRPVMSTFLSSKSDATPKSSGGGGGVTKSATSAAAGVGGVVSGQKTASTKATRVNKSTTGPSSAASVKNPASHVLTMHQKFDASKAAKPTPSTSAAATPTATAGNKNKVNLKR